MKRALPWLLLIIALGLGVQSYRRVARLEQAVRKWHGDLPASPPWWQPKKPSASKEAPIRLPRPSVSSASEERRVLAYAAEKAQELRDLLEAGKYPEAQRLARELSRRLERWRSKEEAPASESFSSSLLRVLKERIRRAPVPSSESSAQPAQEERESP